MQFIQNIMFGDVFNFRRFLIIFELNTIKLILYTNTCKYGRMVSSEAVIFVTNI